MTLIRAIFWVGVMALLVPHDPNLGFAKASASQFPQGSACTTDMNICMHEQASVASLRDLFLARIEQVKLDLAEKR
jgi:hypothetical protein